MKGDEKQMGICVIDSSPPMESENDISFLSWNNLLVKIRKKKKPNLFGLGGKKLAQAQQCSIFRDISLKMYFFGWPAPAVSDPEWDEDVLPAEIQGCIQPGHGLGWEHRSPGCCASSSCSSQTAPKGASDDDTMFPQGLNPLSLQAVFFLRISPRHWAGIDFHSAAPRMTNHPLNVKSLLI